MRQPTILATLDRKIAYHAHKRKRYEHLAERAKEPNMRAYHQGLAYHHAGALEALSGLRQIAPTRTRASSR